MWYFFSSWHHRSTNEMHLSDEDSTCNGPSAVYWLWRSFRWWIIAEDLGTAASSKTNSCARHTRQHAVYVESLSPVEWCSCVCPISWWSGWCNHWDTHLSGRVSNCCIGMNLNVLEMRKILLMTEMVGVAEFTSRSDSTVVEGSLHLVTKFVMKRTQQLTSSILLQSFISYLS